MPQLPVLSTAGRLTLVAPMSRPTLRTPAASVWIMVRTTRLVSLLSLWALQNDWRWPLCVNHREVRQALVLHAQSPSGSVRLLSLRDQPWLLRRGKSNSYSFYTFLDLGQSSEFTLKFFLFLKNFVSSQNCMYDSCNCEKSEDCMCAAVSSYAHACAAAGIQINGWRKTICGE